MRRAACCSRSSPRRCSSPAAAPTTRTAAAARPLAAAATSPTIKVGVPRNFGFLSTLWARDVQPEGVKIEYKYFPLFTDMLTALNSGKIDLTEIGDVGAVQSYVNGGKVQAIAVTEPNDKNCGLLVPKDSTAQTFADLKGKKIAFLKLDELVHGVPAPDRGGGARRRATSRSSRSGPAGEQGVPERSARRVLQHRPEHGRPRGEDRRPDHLARAGTRTRRTSTRTSPARRRSRRSPRRSGRSSRRWRTTSRGSRRTRRSRPPW